MAGRAGELRSPGLPRCGVEGRVAGDGGQDIQGRLGHFFRILFGPALYLHELLGVGADALPRVTMSQTGFGAALNRLAEFDFASVGHRDTCALGALTSRTWNQHTLLQEF